MLLGGKLVRSAWITICRITGFSLDEADSITSWQGMVTRAVALSSVAHVNLGKQGENQGPLGWELYRAGPLKTPPHRTSNGQT